MGGAALPAMMGAQVAGGAVSAWAQGQEGKAAASYYGLLASTAKTNTILNSAAAASKDSEVSAQEGMDSRRVAESVRSTIATARAANAAGGAGAGSKTAEQVVSDSLTRGDLDQQALRYNSDIKRKGIDTNAAFGNINLNAEAAGDEISGKNAMTASRVNQLSTILGTGTSVASSWYMSRLGANGQRFAPRS